MANKQKIERSNNTIRRLDKMGNPPVYRDEELPTQMKFVFSRKKQGTALSSDKGAVNMGSIAFSGSSYEAAPGSYSMRITKRTVCAGSMSTNTDAWYKLWHSRLGTVEMLPFKQAGTMNNSYGLAQKHEAIGGPLNPVYSFPPGTLIQYIESRKGTIRVSATLQGFF
jgi:hypothetical protein